MTVKSREWSGDVDTEPEDAATANVVEYLIIYCVYDGHMPFTKYVVKNLQITCTYKIKITINVTII